MKYNSNDYKNGNEMYKRGEKLYEQGGRWYKLQDRLIHLEYSTVQLKDTLYKIHELELEYGRIMSATKLTGVAKMKLKGNLRSRDIHLKKADGLIMELDGFLYLGDIINTIEYSKNMLEIAKRNWS